MSGALGTVAFVRSIVTSIIAPSMRSIVWPATGTNGTSVTTTSGQQATQSLTGYVPIIEEHRDELTMTEHPVEQGAAITDHAYKLPSMLTLRIGWSTSMPANNPLSLGNLTGVSALNAISLPTLAGFWSTSSDAAINNLYNTLISLQVQRTLLTVTTARRQYTNMLLQGVSIQTDEHTEHALIVTATLKEIIRVNTQVINTAGFTAPVNPASQANPQQTSPVTPQGQQNLTPTKTELLAI